MSTMLNERTLERELRELNAEVSRLEGEKTTAMEAAEKLVEDERKAGRNPVTDATSFEKVDAAYKVADTLADDLENKRHAATRLMRALGHKADGAKTKKAAMRAVDMIMQTPEFQRYIETGALQSGGSRIELPGVEVVSREDFVDRIRAGLPLFGATVDGGDFIVPTDRRFPPVAIPVRMLRVLDLITMSTTDSDAVDFVVETLRSDVAAETALGTAYPEASYAYELETANVRDIGHFTPAHRSNLADAGQLQGLIEGRLETGVSLRLESQVIAGNGVGQNLTGILNTDGISHVQRNTTAAELRLETIHRGITKVRLTLFQEPDAIGIHPTAYEEVVFEKSESGGYLLGPASQETSRTIWGFPAVVTSVFPESTALVGAYKQGAIAWVRSGVQVRASDSHEDFFTKRMVALLAEMRAAFAAWQPRAFCEVDLEIS